MALGADFTQTGTSVNEGKVSLRMKYRQLPAVAGVGIAGGMRIK
jgi:hypothetical protein